ncbi:MAG: Sec-independent protein translocase protein TatB [bacterium]
MFDVGFMEVGLLLIVGLIVLGPERLPKVARTVGMYMRKARSTWSGVQAQIEQELAAEELQKTVLDPKQILDPLKDLKDELNKPIETIKDDKNGSGS